MKIHSLKIWPQYFQKIIDKKKTAELRFNDRNYQIEDLLFLQEYNNEKKEYTGRETYVKITDITEGTNHLISGNVMLSFKKETGLKSKYTIQVNEYFNNNYFKTDNEDDFIEIKEFCEKFYELYKLEYKDISYIMIGKILKRLGYINETVVIAKDNMFVRAFPGIRRI